MWNINKAFPVLTIGITGGSGSGKTTFVQMLSEQLGSIPVIDGDFYMKQAFQIYQDQIFKPDDYVIRHADSSIRCRNFSESVERVRKTLNVISDYMEEKLEQQRDQFYEEGAVIFDWSFLHTLPLWTCLDIRIAVQAKSEARIERLIRRDAESLQKEEAIARIKRKLDNTDIELKLENVIIIDNNNSREELLQRAGIIAAEIIRYKEKEWL